jgi:hypothetical protein
VKVRSSGIKRFIFMVVAFAATFMLATTCYLVPTIPQWATNLAGVLIGASLFTFWLRLRVR